MLPRGCLVVPLPDCGPQKKKCNEQRPCDRCIERGLICQYEPVQKRRRRRASELARDADALSPGSSSEHESLHVNVTRSVPGDLEEDNASLLSARSSTTAFSFDSFDVTGSGDSAADIEDIPRPDLTTDVARVGTPSRSRSLYPDLAMIAPSPVASPLLQFSAPVFMEFAEQRNRRGLVDHFCNVLSHLIVFKEDNGNPFRQLVLPLSTANSPVLNAIFALSSAHLEHRGIESEEKSLDFHNKALQGLAMLIQQNEKANRDEVLGAIMLLVYYEVLVQRGTSNIVNGHLKGAWTIMRSQNQEPTRTSRFLERAFHFYDVITALSQGTAPLGSAPLSAAESSLLSSPSSWHAPPTPSPSSGLAGVDTLLGLVTDLWPLIHRLSHLPTLKVSISTALEANEPLRASVLRTELESTAAAIELALESWTPAIPDALGLGLQSSPDEAARLQSILNNAEAYKQAAFVYLYRCVRAVPRGSEVVQKHAGAALRACGRTVSFEGPMAALLWPLFVASCEVVGVEERRTAGELFGRVEARQGMQNIVRAWAVVKEVWQMGDGGVELCWRDVCRERGVNVVFG